MIAAGLQHADGVGNALVERWLLRHRMPNALERWREAGQERPPSLAFIAIACEPRLLMRVDRFEASVLVRQAEEMIDGITSSRASESAVAAAAFVASWIAVWRAYMKDAAGPKDGQSDTCFEGVGTARATANAWRTAMEFFPEFIENAARPIVQTMLQLGAERLIRLGEPQQKVMALQTVRFAARSSRGSLRGPAIPESQSLDCVRIVQDWCSISGKNALVVPYRARRETIQECALALLSDSTASVHMAQNLPGGAGGTGMQLWEAAEEFHAYAVVAMIPHTLRNMTYERASACAAAAARHASAHLDDPSLPMPDIPEFCEQLSPKMVLATARSVAGATILPRRSTL